MWLKLWLSPALWWASYAAGLATVSAQIMSGQKPSPLLRLHVERLKPRANGGQRPRYEMRKPRMWLASSN